MKATRRELAHTRVLYRFNAERQLVSPQIDRVIYIRLTPERRWFHEPVWRHALAALVMVGTLVAAIVGTGGK